MKKFTVAILIVFVCNSCSFYVADQNKKYGHPANEINTTMQLITGYKIGESLKLDKMNGHYHFRFTNMLKGEHRIVDIFIPKNSEIGRPYIVESDGQYDPSGKEKAYLYIDTKNQREAIINMDYMCDHFFIVGITYSESDNPISEIKLPEATLDYFKKKCGTSKEITCQGQWPIEPNFKWVERSKFGLWASRSRYIISVPLDLAVLALAIAFWDCNENN